MKQEEQIEAGVAAYLKADQAASGNPRIAVIAKMDPVPETGAVIYVEMTFQPIGRGELFTGFVDLGVSCPAFDDRAADDIRDAIDLINAAFPSDQSRGEDLAAAIAAEASGVTCHWYHQEAAPGEAGTERRFVRMKRYKLQFEES